MSCRITQDSVHLRQGWPCCRGQLITGCVSVAGVDKCFPGDFPQGADSCAPVPGGYNMTTFADLLSAGRGVDGMEGSLCDPKVCPPYLGH